MVVLKAVRWAVSTVVQKADLWVALRAGLKVVDWVGQKVELWVVWMVAS